MTTYARIDSGIVAELFTPPDGLTISDCFHSGLNWVQASPGVDIGWAYDGNFTPPGAAVAATLQAQAASALSSGVRIVSTSTPALNGTYSCDNAAQANFTAVQTRINAGRGLPLGLSTVTWIDTAGAAHSFTADQFTNLADAVSDYVYALSLVAMGHGTTLPTQPVTIA